MNRLLLLFACLLASSSFAADPKDVLCILEENAAELLPKLINPQGDPGVGEIEKGIVFSGKSSVKITVLQRYMNFIDGWAYKIREKPKPGEYRYVRFAWKSDGLTGIMLQLHDDKDWHMRYTSGANKFGWDSRTVAGELPNEWKLVTIDLFKDFGEREIHGIALTTFDGTAGYFDHIYFGRSLEALDAIDATGLAGGPKLKLSAEEVETFHQQLESPDASLGYRAFWTLANADASVQDLLAKKVSGQVIGTNAARIVTWLKELDDDDYATREAATRRLKMNLKQARKAVEAELARTASAEVRFRLQSILDEAEQEVTAEQRAEEKTRRILQIMKERK